MTKSRDSLQPALLDRLKQNNQALGRGGQMSREQFRKAVLRDLESLFNATCVLSRPELRRFPQVAHSVLAYGMPPIAGEVASSIEIKEFESSVVNLIRRFEPRIDPKSIDVRAETTQILLNQHNVIGLQIRGLLWNQPYPIELAMRTEVDLETGKVALMPLIGF